jgi:acyl dehydratase
MSIGVAFVARPLVAGEALPPFVIDSIDPQAMKDWAVFLADPNPIHLDADVVRAKGLGDKVINQGPANVAYIMNMLMAAFPGAAIQSLDTKFLDNVYAGDHVTAGGSVASTDHGRAVCDVWLRAGDRTVLSGTATLLVSLASS